MQTRLFKTNCATDWKGRPSHTLVCLGVVASFAEAVALQDKDVAEWQANDLECDKEEREEMRASGDYTEEEIGEAPTGWEIPNERWEMRNEDPTKNLRQFASRWEDGGTWGLVYHLLDL